MSQEWSPEKFGQVLTEIFRRSASDAAFRQRALKTPDAVLEEVGGIPVPAKSRGRTQFVETPAAGRILLPPVDSTNVKSGELSDAELEQVAGGGSPYCMFTSGCYCMCTGKFTENWG